MTTPLYDFVTLLSCEIVDRSVGSDRCGGADLADTCCSGGELVALETKLPVVSEEHVGLVGLHVPYEITHLALVGNLDDLLLTIVVECSCVELTCETVVGDRHRLHISCCRQRP